MPEDNSEYLKRLAAFEQATAGLRPIATVLNSYMNSLLDAGFQRNEALELTKSLQTKLLDIALNQRGTELD
jgi:hypothetical protein